MTTSTSRDGGIRITAVVAATVVATVAVIISMIVVINDGENRAAKDGSRLTWQCDCVNIRYLPCGEIDAFDLQRR